MSAGISTATGYAFGPFRLSGPEGPLLRDGVEIRLQRKTLKVLWLLVRQAGEVVTRAALHDAVWPRMVVVDEALTFQIQALRAALGDTARKPRYIATVHGVGFRFLAQTGSTAQPAEARREVRPPPLWVGRGAELDSLGAAASKALLGQRQIVFVSGEPGIGKTALLEAFLAQDAVAEFLVGSGQCIEQHGSGEAFLPVLEALGRMFRQARGDKLAEVLRHLAPTWLVQTQGLVGAVELAALQQQVAGASRARSLREFAEAVETLTAAAPVLLLLEDLHWSDASTIELLAMLARRTEPARLLVLCTFRPVDAIVASHPVRALKLDLIARGLAVDLPLDGLSDGEVANYIGARFDKKTASDELCRFVYRRCEGHPLFMVQIADFLAQQAAPAPDLAALDDALPPVLTDLVETLLLRLGERERQVLDAASVAGPEFEAASCAGALQLPLDEVEALCDSLARQNRFIEDRGVAVWPDGTTSGRYGFRHALYAQVLRKRLSSARRTRTHRLIAQTKQAAYGARSDEIAAELAAHFEAGTMPEREVEYRLPAARRAERSAAFGEARVHAHRGLAVVSALPEGAARDGCELSLLLVLAACADAEAGYGNATTRALRPRIEGLLHACADAAALHRAHYAVSLSYLFEGRTADCIAVSERASLLFRERGLAALECHTLAQTAVAYFWRGLHGEGRLCLNRSAELCTAVGEESWIVATTTDPEVAFHMAASNIRWMLGFADTALRHVEQGLERARFLRSPHMIGVCLAYAALVRTYRREPEAAIEAAHVCIAECERSGEAGFAGLAFKLKQIALCMLGQTDVALPVFRGIVAAQRAAGAMLTLPLDCALEAEACLAVGRVPEARAAIAAGLAESERTGSRGWEPELQRLGGECALSECDEPAAEIRFRAALHLAGKQEAQALELRAALALARLRQRQNRKPEVCELLMPVLERFREGFDTPDLIEARELSQR